MFPAKKKLLIILAVIILLTSAYLLLSGFCKATDAFISDFTPSPDGSSMTVDIQVSSSAGYIRKAVVKEQSNGNLYLDCYCAFGGINGFWGAKGQFELPLEPETDKICIFRNVNCYQQVLAKDSSGNWQRVH